MRLLGFDKCALGQSPDRAICNSIGDDEDFVQNTLRWWVGFHCVFLVLLTAILVYHCIARRIRQRRLYDFAEYKSNGSRISLQSS
jgi:hypothetical protein